MYVFNKRALAVVNLIGIASLCSGASDRARCAAVMREHSEKAPASRILHEITRAYHGAEKGEKLWEKSLKADIDAVCPPDSKDKKEQKAAAQIVASTPSSASTTSSTDTTASAGTRHTGEGTTPPATVALVESRMFPVYSERGGFQGYRYNSNPASNYRRRGNN